MKLIDENGRLFGKISVIDVVVIAVVAALAGALYLKTNTLTHTSVAVENPTIRYQVLAQAVPDFVEGQIQVGDLFFDEDRGSSGCLGRVVAVEVLPGEKLTEFSDGTAAVAPVEDSINLLVTVEGEGLIENGKYLLNRVYDLGVNSSRNFCTQYVRMTGTVMKIWE